MATSQLRQQQVQQRLESLFHTVSEDNFAVFCTYLAYKGNDRLRRLKDAINLGYEEDRKLAEIIFKRIKQNLDESDFIEYSEYVEEASSNEGVMWYVWRVKFLKDMTEIKQRYFGFVQIGERFLLGILD